VTAHVGVIDGSTVARAEIEAQSHDGLEADIGRLDAIAEEQANAYNSAAPFPHIMIDDFARPEVLDAVLHELIHAGPQSWSMMEDRFQKKSACNTTALMGQKTRELIRFLNGQEVIMFLEKLTGIEGLTPDPFLAGGGLHEIRDGGFLNIHADFNFQEHLRLDRRINLILYLNKDWEEEWGGNLELWDSEMTACAKRITPVFNRCVIFNTTDKNFHGNPQPVKTPDGRTRRSIAMYYYTNGRPDGEVSRQHMSIFKHRPGEESAADKGRRLLKKFIPPIITEMISKK